jgi:hypothetical protein
LLLLLLPLLYLQQLVLPNLCLVLLLISCEGSWLQEVSDEPLSCWNRRLLLSCLLLLLLLMLINLDLHGCLTAHVHGIDGCQTHHTPHTLVQHTCCCHTHRGGAQHA